MTEEQKKAARRLTMDSFALKMRTLRSAVGAFLEDPTGLQPHQHATFTAILAECEALENVAQHRPEELFL